MTQPSAFDIEADDEGTPLPAPPLDSDELEDDEPEDPPSPRPTDPSQLTEEQLRDLQPPKKRGRPRKKTTEPRPLGTPPLIPPSVTAASTQDEDSDDPREWPADALLAWPILLRWLAKHGMGAEAVYAIVSRKLIDPRFQSVPTRFGQVKGTSVVAVGSYSAAEVLHRYLVDVFHSVGGAGGGAGCPAADYTVEWHWSSGRSNGLKTTHITLDAYQVLIAQREQAAAFEASADAWRSGAGEGVLTRAPVVGFGRPAAPHAPHAPAQAGDGALRERLGYLERVKEETDRAIAEGRAPREVPAVGPAVSVADEDAKIARAVTAALAAAGIKPKSDMDRMAEMMAANNDALMKNIIALYGDPASRAVGAGAAQPTPMQAADTVQDTVAGLKKLLQEFKTLREAEGIFKEALGADDDDKDDAITPTQITVEQKPQDFMAKVGAFFKGLPPGAIAQTMAVAGAFLEGSPVGEIVKKAAAAAQAAGAVQAGVEKARGPSWGPTQ